MTVDQGLVEAGRRAADESIAERIGDGTEVVQGDV